eukprot:scaffold279685_cov35-Tisochrysis_lutea.AAC.2
MVQPDTLGLSPWPRLPLPRSPRCESPSPKISHSIKAPPSVLVRAYATGNLELLTSDEVVSWPLRESHSERPGDD